MPSIESSLIRHIMEKSRHAVIVTDSDLVITDCNAGFMHELRSSTSPVGLKLTDLMTPECAEVITGRLCGDTTLSLDLRGKGHSITLVCAAYDLEPGWLLVEERIVQFDDDVFQKMTILNSELVNMSRQLHMKNQELLDAQAHIKMLKGLLPICMFCKKIRDDDGYWQTLEKYITEHSDALFSHGICEECMQIKYPAEYEAIKKKKADQRDS